MMKTSFYLITALISACVLQGKAVAADLAATPYYTKAAPVPTADLWSGPYLGLSAGGRWMSETWSTIKPPSSHEFESTSARLGIYGGYNWQVHPLWVVGLEADIAWANNSQSIDSIPGLTRPGTVGTTEINNNADGGIRARAGYLITPQTLVFASGGVSWLQNEINVAATTTTRIANWCAPDTIVTTKGSDSVSGTSVGWSLGGGIETKVAPNWLLRGEYRYASYENRKASMMKGAQRIDVDLGNRSTQTVMVGLAYQFGQ